MSHIIHFLWKEYYMSIDEIVLILEHQRVAIDLLQQQVARQQFQITQAQTNEKGDIECYLCGDDDARNLTKIDIAFYREKSNADVWYTCRKCED